MKEKRYYCDLALSTPDKNFNRVIISVLLISFVVVTAISSLINYNIMMHNHGEDIETYSESVYEYLDEIADNVISKDGINVAAIPEDVVKYEITYKDDEIIFKYSLDNNEGRKFATSASMIVTLSKDFEVLSREPNFSSEEEYVKQHKMAFYMLSFSYGFCTWIVMTMVSCIGIVVAVPISMMHKEKDMKKNIS